MDYEKKYKNALTIAQSRFKIEKDESVLTCLGMMFPELRESEEDESILEALIYDVERLPMQGVLTHRPCDSYIKFLKALRPGWKPTEEQMKALIDCTIGNEYDVHALVRLWAELKKL